MRWASIAVMAAGLAVTGCGRFFVAKGTVSGEGSLGTWSSTPQGCTRDSFDGLSGPESSSVLTFFWQDPSIHDPLRDLHRPTAPDAPMRLELWREGSLYAMKLDTVKTSNTRFDATTCSTLAVETHEAEKSLPEGRSTLAGSLRLDCRTETSHLTADVHFQRCEY